MCLTMFYTRRKILYFMHFDIVCLSDKLVYAWDKEKLILEISVTLEKTFDTVSHTTLLEEFVV